MHTRRFFFSLPHFSVCQQWYEILVCVCFSYFDIFKYWKRLWINKSSTGNSGGNIYPCSTPWMFADWSRSLSVQSSLLRPSSWAPPGKRFEAPAAARLSVDLSQLSCLVKQDNRFKSWDPARCERNCECKQLYNTSIRTAQVALFASDMQQESHTVCEHNTKKNKGTWIWWQ